MSVRGDKSGVMTTARATNDLDVFEGFYESRYVSVQSIPQAKLAFLVTAPGIAQASHISDDRMACGAAGRDKRYFNTLLKEL